MSADRQLTINDLDIFSTGVLVPARLLLVSFTKPLVLIIAATAIASALKLDIYVVNPSARG